MKYGKYRLGMGQMLVEGGAVDKNISRAIEMIKAASEIKCMIIVLPECLDIGWTNPRAYDLAQTIPGERSDKLCRAARESGICVVAGLSEKSGEHVYSAAVFISSDGKILYKHRKINILTIAQNLYSTGDSLGVIKTSLGVIGVDICSDNFPDSLVLGHSLARMGAQVILSPSSWAVEANHNNSKDPYGSIWKESYTTLARLYDLTIVGVSNVGGINAGVWKGYKCIGCSLAVGPKGHILAEGPYGETSEDLIEVPVQLIKRSITGTAIAEQLKSKGYKGP